MVTRMMMISPPSYTHLGVYACVRLCVFPERRCVCSLSRQGRCLKYLIIYYHYHHISYNIFSAGRLYTKKAIGFNFVIQVDIAKVSNFLCSKKRLCPYIMGLLGAFQTLYNVREQSSFLSHLLIQEVKEIIKCRKMQKVH